MNADTKTPTVSEEIREAVAPDVRMFRIRENDPWYGEYVTVEGETWFVHVDEFRAYRAWAESKVARLSDRAITAEAENTRLKQERDDAEQRVTNLANALASAHRARGAQEKRADEADDRRITLERDRIHPAFSVEVQEHRQQAYEGGCSDGYAEGFAKSQSETEAENTRLRANAVRDAEALAGMREALKPFADLSFSFDGFSFDPAEIVVLGRCCGRFQPREHDHLQKAIDRARAALAPKETSDA